MHEAGGEDGQPDRCPKCSQGRARRWRQVRWLVELLEILAVSRDAVALAAIARATVVVGDVVFQVPRP